MTKSSSSSGKSPPDPRKARLARALRDNLKRRKEQARERQVEHKDDGAGDSGGGKGPVRP